MLILSLNFQPKILHFSKKNSLQVEDYCSAYNLRLQFSCHMVLALIEGPECVSITDRSRMRVRLYVCVRELRLTEAIHEPHICENILQYNVHAERKGSLRYAKGMSETMQTLHGLVYVYLMLFMHFSFVLVVLAGLTLPPGWAGCYTCPTLRSYQFRQVRIPGCSHKVTVNGYKAENGYEAVNKWL